MSVMHTEKLEEAKRRKKQEEHRFHTICVLADSSLCQEEP